MSSEGDPELAATFARPRRLHVAAALAHAVSALRGIAVPLLAAVLLGSGSGLGRALAYGAAGVLLSLAAGVVTWRATSYQLLDGTLRFRRGVVSPDDTAIPAARIQAIDTVEGPIQRLFGVVELHVQTPGGGERGEVVLTAVAPRDARALRAALGHTEPATPAAHRRLGLGALLVAGLTAPQFGVVLPVVGALFAGANDLFGNVAGQDVVGRVEHPRHVLAIAAAVLGATFLVSFAAAVVGFAGFEVEREGDRLRIRRGLLQRRAASVPVSRVDGVTVVEGLLRAPFGLATVRLETAGYRAEGAAARTLFPLVRTRDVPALLAEMVPGLDGHPPAFVRPPGRSLRRYALAPALAGALAGAAAAGVAVALGGPGLAWLAAGAGAAGGALHGVVAFRAAGFHLGAERVVLRMRHGTARRTLVARRGRLQQVEVRQNPLQRRAALASFALALGSRRRGTARHLQAEDAEAALRALSVGR